MALSSSFRERLEQMEFTRNQRLALLQAEKELQINKSQFLASKLSNIRTVEQRCLTLEHKIALQKFVISSLKSQIDGLDFKYLDNLQKFRVLKSEVEELEELEKEKERVYSLKTQEMEEFRAKVQNFFIECRVRVEELRNSRTELNSSFLELKGNNGHLNSPTIVAAEKRKSELIAVKEELERNLASNVQLRTQLQKQLQSILIAQNQERGKLCQLDQNKCLRPQT